MRTTDSGTVTSALAYGLGGALEADPDELAELNARYGLEMQPETFPELLDRFGLQVGERLTV